MKCIKNHALSVLLGCLVLGASQLAHAQTSATVPQADSITYVGMIGNQGWLISTHLLTGNCAWTSIGGAGGLTANSTITGTSTSDWIVLPSSSVSACGWTIAPLNLNGRTLTINGVGGGDEIDAGAAGSVVVNGGSGNDYIRSTGFGHSFWGGTGNDNLNGRSGSNLRGEGDNDAHCVAPGYTANVINGSTGTDTRCGNATTIAGIDSVNCNPCFF